MGKPGVPLCVCSHFFTDHTLLEGTDQPPGELLNLGLFSRLEGLSEPHKENAPITDSDYSVLLISITLACFYIFIVLNNAAKNMTVQISL